MSQNRLGSETSPYLLQHEDNPVHWWAWGPEALHEAKKTGKPILLSVGYAACHWCHVMAHESFEDQATADVMNDLFINIKVDREERPDIDTIYMQALHMMGEQGGWPLTMFLTPDGEPFWGGTYFPKEAKFGRPSFIAVLKEVAKIFRERPDDILHNVTAIKTRLTSQTQVNPAFDVPEITENLIRDVAERLVTIIDQVHGGIQGAPKFPQVSFFNFLWRTGLRFCHKPSLAAVEKTLLHICQGGIYDHLGGGFARYSVDARWLVPHFEKMLYDNAQLISLMTEIWRETQNPLFKSRIEETVDWVLREMVAEGSGFASSLDADSEGEEGKYYVWTAEDIEHLLGQDDASFFSSIYDVSPSGNWENKTILNRLNSLDPLSDDQNVRLAKLRNRLLIEREKRVRPGWDDKVLADWNGLMITALAHAGTVFNKSHWLDAAKSAFSFIATHMCSEDGRLSHSYRAGQAKAPATLNDYANMIKAALTLFQTTNETDYLTQAQAWAEILNEQYWAEENNGYYYTADDTKDVIIRTWSATEDATPNGNGVMISNLMALYILTGEQAYLTKAEKTLKAFKNNAVQNLFAHTGIFESALDVLEPTSIIGIGTDSEQIKIFLATLHHASLPGAILQAITDPSTLAKNSPVHGKTAIDGKPTAYVCIGSKCSLPVTEPQALLDTAKQMRGV